MHGLSACLSLLSSPSLVQVILALGVGLALITLVFRTSSRDQNRVHGPPYVPEQIPYISNTINFMTDAGAFLKQVSELLESAGSDVVKCYLGFRPFYFVSGTRNVQRLFGSPENLDGNFIHFILMSKQWGMTKNEMSRFKEDRSGRQSKPIPGCEGLSEDRRVWHKHNQLYTDYLTDKAHSNALAAEFSKRFSERLDQQGEGQDEEWITASLLDTLRTHMSECASETLFGTRMFELNPGFTKCYWEYDECAGRLIGGPPAFMQPRAARKKDRLHAMVRKHIDAAFANFDWNSPEANSFWEPHFGSRLSRESGRWLRNQGFSDHVLAGHTLATLFGLNGNTVPITAWALSELLQDTALLAAIRVEVDTAAKKETGELDPEQVVRLPLLQALYTEAMRLHISFSVTREIRRGPVEISAGIWAETGAVVQTLSTVAHLDEQVWGVEGHPASKFWAWRHIQVDKVRDEQTGEMVPKMRFAMRGRPTSFFPYGGGFWVCPGRHFGKMEIMLALALIVAKMDLEFLRWTQLDGTESSRPALNDSRYAGSVAMFPDRDLSFRWRKRQRRLPR